MAVILRCFCPLLLVLAVVGVCMGVGIWELQKQTVKLPEPAGADKSTSNSTSKADDKAKTMTEATPINKSAVAAIAAAGAITGLLGAFALSFTQCKQISDTLIEARSHVKFADHSSKIGYQHAVIKDLKLLRKLLSSSLKPFRSKQAGCWELLKACSLVAACHALLRAFTQALAFMLLCCCACCLSDAAAVQDKLLPPEKSAAATPPPDQAEQGGDVEVGKPPTPTDQAKQEDDNQPRIVVFIDDLDRCKPSKIIEVLEAINLVLAGAGFAVVVGMDKDFVGSAIQSAYKEVEIMKEEGKAAEFLDKIVQVELLLPTPAAAELEEFLSAQGVNLKSAGPKVSNNTSTTGELLPTNVGAAPLSSSVPASADVSSQGAGSSAAEGRRGLSADAASSSSPASASRQVPQTDQESQAPRADAANDAAAAAGTADAVDSKEYSDVESRMIICLHAAGQLLGATPRDLKRMLNRYLLAKRIMQAALGGNLDSADEEQLLAWVLLWWKYPLAMRELIKRAQAQAQLAQEPKPQQAGSKLINLLKQHREDSTTLFQSVSHLWFKASKATQLAASAVAAAKKALADANTALAGAAGDADKKKAASAVKEATSRLQLAELWSLCSPGPAGNSELQDMLDIDITDMLHGDHAEPRQRIRTAVYRLFSRQ